MSTATKFYSTRALREVDNVDMYRRKLGRSETRRFRARIIRWLLALTVIAVLALALYQFVWNRPELMQDDAVWSCVGLDCLAAIRLPISSLP